MRASRVFGYLGSAKYKIYALCLLGVSDSKAVLNIASYSSF